MYEFHDHVTWLNVKMFNCCDTNICVIVNDLHPLKYMHLQLSLTQQFYCIVIKVESSFITNFNACRFISSAVSLHILFLEVD